jgi:hypothetical protein
VFGKSFHCDLNLFFKRSFVLKQAENVGKSSGLLIRRSKF